MLENLHKANHDKVDEMLNTIQEAAINNENLDHLMEATKVCSLAKLHQHYLK
jgi:methylmalonyl-CoA mutase